MATSQTYEAQCTAVGSFGYANYFKLYVVLQETDVSTSGNSSKIQYNVYCQSSGSGSINALHLKYFNLNGTDIINSTVNVNVSSPNAYISIASGTTGAIAHNSDGSKSVSFSAKIQGSTYGVSASISGTFALTSIGRYTNLTSLTVKSKTVNSITLQYTTDGASWLFAKLDDGKWLNGGEPFKSNTTSGEFTIYYKDRASTQRLDANTSYKITVLCRALNRDSEIDTQKDITVATYDIAKISAAPNFNHGSNASLTTTNPSGATMSLAMKIGNTSILTRTPATGANTISFTDAELDTIYKLYGAGTTLTVTYTLSITINSTTYTNTATCTITLTGNQKTIKENVGGTWKRGKVWVKINGTWKQGIVWENVNGTWKKAI